MAADPASGAADITAAGQHGTQGSTPEAGRCCLQLVPNQDICVSVLGREQRVQESPAA
jgi:hypothetical protein